MTKGNPNWGRNDPVDWRFRIRGKNLDCKMVSLGNFQDEKEAEDRCDELVKEGYYRNLRVQRLKPKPTDSGSLAP